MLCLSIVLDRLFGGQCYWQRLSIPAAITRPARNSAFPCLQLVTFVPTSAGLTVNAVYATQQIFDKAYGNYLGLAQLGAFMAHEMDMPLARLNVNVGVAKLERISKVDKGLAPVIASAKACLVASPSHSAPSMSSLFAGAAI